MDTNVDNLKRLIESIKTLNLWGRIFGWSRIKSLLIDAVSDMQKILTNNENLQNRCVYVEQQNIDLIKDLGMAKEELIKSQATIDKLTLSAHENMTENTSLKTDLSSANTKISNNNEKVNALSSDNRLLAQKNEQLTSDIKRLSENEATKTQSISGLTNRKSELEIELAEIKVELHNAKIELGEVKGQNTKLVKDDEFRKLEHSKSMEALQKIHNQISEERNKEVEERNNKELTRLMELKETWSKHEENSKNIIKSICQKHTIQYLEKVPFKGEPDNTLVICDEHIIFDAKSPGGDDLKNFPNYLKDQAEKAKKYAKQDTVKSDVFFVVPSNTLEYLNVFVYRHGDHNVYIISVDALEPVILGLKKIEDYEFAEQLSPEDRENICRILGRFAHLSKRRIQVDSFFAKQFIELAYKCEIDLPTDILESVIEFEKADKLNPPQEKRTKAIPIGELEKESKNIKQEAEGRGIIIEDVNISDRLNELPLYKNLSE